LYCQLLIELSILHNNCNFYNKPLLLHSFNDVVYKTCWHVCWVFVNSNVLNFLFMKKLLIISSFVAGLFLSSCGPSRYTVREQPVAPVYVRPVAPAPHYVWVDGDWQWRRGNYMYSNGYWAKPRNKRVYVTGAWVQTNKGYYWRKGYWK
jgi:hypothetical protein